MTKREINIAKWACAYGIGLVCGKHNLSITKKELKKELNDMIKKNKDLFDSELKKIE